MLDVEQYADNEIIDLFDVFRDSIYMLARKKGWWPELEGMTNNPSAEEFQRFVDKINIPERIAKIHSELSEAYEAARDPVWLQDKHCPAFTNFSIELADSMLAIFNLAGALQIPIGAAMLAKIKADEKRPYKHGNKRF
jgi:hypothetical protein